MTAAELANYGNALPSLSSPIAENGDKRAPIAGSSNETDTQASVKFGLPARMSEPLDQDGIPVPRQDLNGIYNLLSRIVHFLMAGGRIPYMSSESVAINGYPTGAEVSYLGHNYKSLVNSNTAVPTDTTKWACIDYLPLTGGIVSGTIVSTAYENGKTSLVAPNGMYIGIGIGVNTIYLVLGTNGYFAWNGENIVRSLNGIHANLNGEVSYPCWPNYSASFTIPSGWTATANGWIRARRGYNDNSAVIYIDGVMAWDSGAADAVYGCGIVPIAKGSVVTYTQDVFEFVSFIPAKVS